MGGAVTPFLVILTFGVIPFCAAVFCVQRLNVPRAFLCVQMLQGLVLFVSSYVMASILASIAVFLSLVFLLSKG